MPDVALQVKRYMRYQSQQHYWGCRMRYGQGP